MAKLLLLEKDNGIAIITLNRPEAMNALCRELREEITAAFRHIQADSTTRVAILTANGRAFCAGFDLKEMSGDTAGDAAEASANMMAEAITAFEGPLIAAVNGHAITGGFELALACDMIIASRTASFADTHARVGILPGWGLSQRLPRLIGLARAKELSFTGNTISAEQAAVWGLVNRVVEPDALLSTARQLADDMCGCVPHILRQYKRLLEDGYNLPLQEALAYEAKLGLESAKAASAAIIASRREGVLERGRDQKSK